MTKYSRLRFALGVLALACAASFVAAGTAQADGTQQEKGNWFHKMCSWFGGTTANTGAAAGNLANNTGGVVASAASNTGATLAGNPEAAVQIVAEPVARTVNMTGEAASETAGAPMKAAEAVKTE